MKMLREVVVPAVVGRHSHNGTGAISGEDIISYPYRDQLIIQWIDAICSGEYPGDLLHCSDPFTLRPVFSPGKVGFHLIAMVGGSDLPDKFMFGGQDHEHGSEDSVGTGGKDIQPEI